MNIKYALYGALFACLIIFIYFLIKLLIEIKTKKYISYIFDNFSKKEEERLVEKKAVELMQGETEDKRFISKIDTLLIRSQIKNVIPFLSSELLLVFVLILAVFLFIIINSFTHFWIAGLAASVVGIFAVVTFLQILANVTFNKIDDQQLSYVNLLKNISASNSDIVTIFEKSIPYTKKPLKQYTEQFVFECKHGVSLKIAFDNYTKKVENKRFAKLLKNILISSKHTADYESVFDSSRIIFKSYYSEKYRRKLAVQYGRGSIAIMIILGGVTFKLLEGFTGDLWSKLVSTGIGNLMLIYFLVVFIYTLNKLITLNKLNY